MPKYTFSEVQEELEKMTSVGIEPEVSLFMLDNEYMIIGYKDKCSFQRCGVRDGSGEYFYTSLDELYSSITIDGILLARDWDKITSIECANYEWC